MAEYINEIIMLIVCVYGVHKNYTVVSAKRGIGLRALLCGILAGLFLLGAIINGSAVLVDTALLIVYPYGINS